MKFEDKELRDILLRENYVSAEDLTKASSMAQARRMSLVDYLLEGQFLTRDLLGQAVAESFNVSYADLNSSQPSKEQVLRIPEARARELRVVIFKEDKKSITIATDAPLRPNLLSELTLLFFPTQSAPQGVVSDLQNIASSKTLSPVVTSSPLSSKRTPNPSSLLAQFSPQPPKKIVIAYALSDDIDAAFHNYRKSLDVRFSEIIKNDSRVAPEIINQIMEDAVNFRASDIHFEPQERDVVIRFRIDGVLQEAGRVPREYYETILNRIKVLAHLRIDEHNRVQDGAVRHEGSAHVLDLRISIAPTVFGEKTVIRVFAQYVQGLGLSDLGFSAHDQELVRAAVDKPFGMILVTGPTGSGKTTTLYALLKLLNTTEVNITTIEDPVEYKVLGINQIQVNAQTNVTFAQGLRSIVRQDPDIILVGEIRDRETAEISVNAALTGHLLLSTFHANTAAASIPRLIDMGIEPFLLASTLEIVIAQRLIRKICESCRVSTEVDIAPLRKRYALPDSLFPHDTFSGYVGKGCPTCKNSGYRGRTALFEFVAVTPEIRELITKNPVASLISKAARDSGSRSLFEDGFIKVQSGVTTLEELLRVIEPS